MRSQKPIDLWEKHVIKQKSEALPLNCLQSQSAQMNEFRFFYWQRSHYAKFGCLHNLRAWDWSTNISFTPACMASCIRTARLHDVHWCMKGWSRLCLWSFLPGSVKTQDHNSATITNTSTDNLVIQELFQISHKSRAAFHTPNANHTVNLHAEMICLALLATKQCKCI